MYLPALAAIFLVAFCQADFSSNPSLSSFDDVGCTLVGQSIFCFGGDATSDIQCTNQTLRLDLANFNFNVILTLNWAVAQANICNAASTVVTIPSSSGSSSVLAYSGIKPFSNSSLGYLLNPSDSSILQTITNPSNSSLFTTYYSAGVYLSSGNKVWMFGGENTMQHLPTVTNPYFLDGTSVLMYDVASNQMSMINAATPQNTTRVQHTATLTADGSKIYVLGGFTQPAFSNFSPNVTVQTDLNIWSYDTTSTQWQAVTPQLDSPGLGLARATHTTTLLPNTTRMLIFGGYLNSMYQSAGPSDFALVYDYAENKLYNGTQNITNPRILTQSAYHSAVLYPSPTGENFLFILFGVTNTKNGGMVNILNVTSPASMTWLSNVNGPQSGGQQGGNGTQSSNTNSQSLSTGAIAGIAVGAAVAGIGIIGAFVYWWIMKKKRKEQIFANTVLSDPRNNNQHHALLTTTVSDNKPFERTNKPFEGTNKPFDTNQK